MIQATITSKGQITIPKKIRDCLNLHAGDHLVFLMDRKGQIILTGKTIDIEDIFGMFHHKSKGKTTAEDMNEAISNRMRRKYK